MQKLRKKEEWNNRTKMKSNKRIKSNKSDIYMIKPFEGLLGNNCELRMLEYLLPLQGIDFSIDELAEEVGVSILKTTRIIKKFVEWEILIPRTIIDTTYSINHESPIVKSIEQFNNLLIENILGDETLYEIHDYWEAQKLQISSEDKERI